MHLRLKLLHLFLAALLAVGVAACGDDDDDDAAAGDDTEEAAAGGDFCDALRTFNRAVFEVQVEDDASEAELSAAHETLDPLWTAVEASAPAERADTVDDLGATIDALGEGDAGPFNDDSTSETYFTMLSEVVPDCVDETTEITAVDYAFEGVPDTMPAGEAGILLVNETENDEQHEFIIFKKADGDTRTAEEILNDPASEEQGPGEFAGAVFATPGATAGAFVDLTPGDYLAICFIPVGGGEEGPPHFTQGMVADFSVA